MRGTGRARVCGPSDGAWPVGEFWPGPVMRPWVAVAFLFLTVGPHGGGVGHRFEQCLVLGLVRGARQYTTALPQPPRNRWRWLSEVQPRRNLVEASTHGEDHGKGLVIALLAVLGVAVPRHEAVQDVEQPLARLPPRAVGPLLAVPRLLVLQARRPPPQAATLSLPPHALTPPLREHVLALPWRATAGAPGYALAPCQALKPSHLGQVELERDQQRVHPGAELLGHEQVVWHAHVGG